MLSKNIFWLLALCGLFLLPFLIAFMISFIFRWGEDPPRWTEHEPLHALKIDVFRNHHLWQAMRVAFLAPLLRALILQGPMEILELGNLVDMMEPLEYSRAQAMVTCDFMQHNTTCYKSLSASCQLDADWTELLHRSRPLRYAEFFDDVVYFSSFYGALGSRYRMLIQFEALIKNYRAQNQMRRDIYALASYCLEHQE